jgi:hypothetical protein
MKLFSIFFAMLLGLAMATPNPADEADTSVANDPADEVVSRHSSHA